MDLRGLPLQGTISEELARCLPTPVRRLAVPQRSAELWLKDDGLTGISYGGNKLRKLPPIIADALSRSKGRIVTVGAAGSHHVLATTLFAAREGLRTAALVVPQLGTAHVINNLRCALACGLEVIPVAAARDVPFVLRQLLRRDDAWVGPGAMGSRGASGFADAVAELVGQIGRGECPEPDVIVLAVGSGSSAAGLLVGILEQRLKTRLMAVSVNANPAVRPMVLGQAWALLRQRGGTFDPLRAGSQLAAHLEVDRSYVGGGYGVPSPASHEALETANANGLVLEHTYTGKAFAAALASAKTDGQRVMFWNTVSSASLASVLLDAPSVADLPPSVRPLLLPVNLAV